MKKIHLIMSRESFEELQKLKAEIYPNHKIRTYEEYLKDEELNPSYCLFG